MPATKSSSSKLAPKSKRKRKEQLANARKCRKIEQTRDIPIEASNEVESVSAETALTATHVGDSVLGDKTRSQFKTESYSFLAGTESSKSDCSDSSKKAIVELSQFNMFVNKLLCPQCKQASLTFHTDTKKKCGLAVYGVVYCSVCEEGVEGAEGYLAKRDADKSFGLNKQAVYSALSCGLGATSFNNFCENLDLQGMHHKTFHTKSNSLCSKLDALEQRVFSQTVDYVRQVHAKHLGITLSEDDVLDISVSYDGTWLTRGHSSKIGAGCVVDILTGLCVDVHTMSTYCQVCETTGQQIFRHKPADYPAWLAQHQDKCDKNFTGSSGRMEVEAAQVLWCRSVERHKLRYTVLLSDGDAKTFNHLASIKPYGEDVEITKEECINHVSKRLGTALRNVTADCRKKGVTLGGRGRGQLTQNAIRKLTIYYNRAVWGASSVEEMKKAVNASLLHCYSTDDKPRHELCPSGQDSWCFYQAALAKHQTPGPHEKLVHTPLNYKLLDPYLAPIYQRLSDPQLLSRCVSGKTQNSNECLHSLIWSRCFKEKFVSRRWVHFAVVTAAREFNFGAAAAQDTASFFGFVTGHHMKRLAASRQQKRIRNSLKFQRDKATKRREIVRAAKAKHQEELIRLEGGPGYAAGGFLRLQL